MLPSILKLVFVTMIKLKGITKPPPLIEGLHQYFLSKNAAWVEIEKTGKEKTFEIELQQKIFAPESKSKFNSKTRKTLYLAEALAEPSSDG